MKSEFYEFKKEDVYDFARSIGAVTRPKGRELFLKKCPYCQSTKDQYTFSINTSTGQYQCKRASCGVAGNMITLAKDFNLDLGRDVSAYHNINNYNQRYHNYGFFTEREVEAQAIEILGKRGIAPEVVQRYQVTTTQKFNRDVLVFPFLDSNQNLKCIKYRWIEKLPKDKGKEFFEKDNMPFLFGVYQCRDNSRVVITEGQIDSLSVATAGIDNAVSVPGGCNNSTWIPYCYEWLRRFEEIVVFGDCEKGEITLVNMITERFSKNTIKVVRVADYLGCKDANEILQKHGKDAVIHAIENAETIISDGIIPAETIKRVNYRDIPAFTTGVNDLNSLMEGGLRLGDLLVCTGKRGDGKSTFVSQMIGFMLNNENAKPFIYSGELVESQVMEWLNSQLAGSKNYSQETLEKIQSWYKGRLFVYDNNKMSDSYSEIFDRCITAVQRYGCNIFILDNLMTAMRGTGTDIFQQQSKFVNECAQFAKTYKVVVILIAHPNKGGISGDNDSVSGSSNVTDAATYVLWYQRPDRIDNSENYRELSISKNRTNGKLKKGIRLNYDEDSRRITDEYTNPKKLKFKWELSEDGFEPIDFDDTIPF